MSETTITTASCAAPFMSAETDKLFAAFAAFQAEVEQPKRKSNNPYFRSKYADLTECVTTAQPFLAKHGLSVTQLCAGDRLLTLLLHTSGQWLKSEMPFPVDRYTDPQKLGSAMTYFRRYAYCALLGLSAEPDDDANSISENAQQAAARQGLKQPPKPKAPAYTPEQLDWAMNEVQKCATYDEYKAATRRVLEKVPALNCKDTPFFDLCCMINQNLKPAQS